MYKVYLVDDDRLILDELADTIPWMDNGFFVVGRNTDPVKAVCEIREVKPDVVFCDLKMPEMDGNQLNKALKEDGCGAKVVMLSAYDDFVHVREFFKQQGFDYILKPVDIEEIQIVLAHLAGELSRVKPYKESVGCFGSDDERKQTNNPGFNDLLGYVEEHFAEKISLDSLSEQFSFSRGYICRLFQKNLGKSMNGYLTQLRMERAKELLKDKTKFVKEVAYETGYSDYYHFFKVFKDYYGLSPKEMRESELW